jgi:hypothetical protein
VLLYIACVAAPLLAIAATITEIRSRRGAQ